MNTIKTLKEEIKVLATELKTNKTNTKEMQRSGVYAGDLQYKRIRLKRECRHKHIAYSMLRGRKYEEIERTCRTEPNFDYIREIMDAYTPKEAPENVRTCA